MPLVSALLIYNLNLNSASSGISNHGLEATVYRPLEEQGRRSTTGMVDSTTLNVLVVENVGLSCYRKGKFVTGEFKPCFQRIPLGPNLLHYITSLFRISFRDYVIFFTLENWF